MNEKQYLRDLAQHQAELAEKPENHELIKAWYAHNSLQGERPMLVFEEDTCLQDLFELKCQTPMARVLEEQLLKSIKAKELIADDKVVPNYVRLPVKIDSDFFGVQRKSTAAEEGVGYHIDPILCDLEEDLHKLSPSVFYFDREEICRLEDYANDCFGGVLPTRRVNALNNWHFAITAHVVHLMGMENMYIAMYETPEELHQLMAFLVEDFKRLLRWEEKEGILFPNAGNDYMGSGSYCFNKELPAEGHVVSTQTWGHINSQESVGISPTHYAEFIFPYIHELAQEFGLLYYGCCEPVHTIWDSCLSKLQNLRKVSISPWCDEEIMAERLANTSVIYSRKPNPNFLGVDPILDEDAFKRYMKHTIDLTRDCRTEIIFRDIYTLHGNPDKARRALEIVRGLL